MAAIALLGASNWVANTQLGERAYVAWNLAVAGGLVTLARRAGHDAEELGLGRAHLSVGLRTGGLGIAAVALVYGGLAASKTGRAVFADERVTTLSGRQAAWQAAVRIPLGTVVLEEVAFRGVLPALLADSPGWPRHPKTVTAGLFGLWHVLPSRQLHLQNAGVQRAVGRSGAAGTMAAAVTATTAAGLVLQRLRDRSGHLAAPALVHLGTNVLGFAAARMLGARRPVAWSGDPTHDAR